MYLLAAVAVAAVVMMIMMELDAIAKADSQHISQLIMLINQEFKMLPAMFQPHKNIMLQMLDMLTMLREFL